MASAADSSGCPDPVRNALLAWKDAFKLRRDDYDADCALSAFPVSSWRTWQLLHFAELVWETITEHEEEEEDEEEEEEEEKEEEEEEEDGKEERYEDCGEDFYGNSEALVKAYEESRIELLHKQRQDDLYLGVQFSDLLWRRAAKKTKLLVKLLWGAAADWDSAEVADAEEYDIGKFAEAVDRWYSVHAELDEAKAVLWSLLKENKWGPEQLESLWEKTGAFKAVWKGLSLPELGRVVRLAIKHTRAPLSSRYNQEFDSEEEESDDDSKVGNADDHEEVYSDASMFRALCKMVELPEGQQRELFKTGMKKLFKPEMLYTLDEELDLNLTPEEWKAVVAEETPEELARFVREMLEEEAYWCGESPPRQSRHSTGPASNGSDCTNNAKRGCLRRQCGACCKKAPGGACAVHLGSIPPATKAPSLGQCMGVASFAATAAPLAASSGAPLASARAPAPAYCEPLYTPQEARVVRSAADLEEIVKGGVSGVKRIVFRDYNVNSEQFAKLLAVVPKLECLEMDDGEGYMLSGDEIKGLAAACPNLKKFSMESAHNIKDDTFAALLKGCPALEYVGISGIDKISCQLSDKSLKLLRKDVALVPKLRKLYIIDQHVSKKEAEKLVKARPKLFIQGGTSDGDGYASMMVMQAMGCLYGDGIWEVGAGVVKPRSFGANFSPYDFNDDYLDYEDDFGTGCSDYDDFL